ncbi:MAG: hypothetical protein ACRC62_32780 [Microcoleus sp.]
MPRLKPVLDKVGDSAKKIGQYINNFAIGIAVLIASITGLQAYLKNQHIYSPNQVMRLIGVKGASADQLETVLRSLIRRLGADRAFVFFYDENEKRQTVSVFKQEYQAQVDGLKSITQGQYAITAGVAHERYENHLSLRCTFYAVDELPPDDRFTKALKLAAANYHASCPFEVEIKGRVLIGVVAVEGNKDFRKNQMQVERELSEAGGWDVTQALRPH